MASSNSLLHFSILLVDDEPLMRRMIERSLVSYGHTVHLANDGAEGLGAFREWRCDLVITDSLMPIMSGEGLAVAVKEISPRTPVLLISGLQRGVACRAVDHRLRKPFTTGELMEAIAAAMAACAGS